MICEQNERFNLQLRSLLDHIKADWERIRSQDEIKIMREYAVNARIIATLFSCKLNRGFSIAKYANES